MRNIILFNELIKTYIVLLVSGCYHLILDSHIPCSEQISTAVTAETVVRYPVLVLTEQVAAFFCFCSVLPVESQDGTNK
jgi:hypothetical protein